MVFTASLLNVQHLKDQCRDRPAFTRQVTL